MNKAILLDRDGTINLDPGYISEEENFHLYPFAAQAIRKFNEMGFLVFVITNQSGIARGIFSWEKLTEIHQKMINELNKENAKIDEFYISPYHKDGIVEPYNIDHENRKPNLGLFKLINEKYLLKHKKSFMIGDRYSDIEFGVKAELKTILVLSGLGENEFYENRRKWQYKPDFITSNLLSAAKLIDFLENIK
ncbi:MAG: HAD family hydrolase [Candidatus Cloacimonetes bacterium]|nr:HAD family hydrolase [Candidatus Cloacimonadota bacterium]